MDVRRVHPLATHDRRDITSHLGARATSLAGPAAVPNTDISPRSVRLGEAPWPELEPQRFCGLVPPGVPGRCRPFLTGAVEQGACWILASGTFEQLEDSRARGFACAANRRKHLRSVNLFATTRGEGVDVRRGESAVRAGLKEPIEVLEHRHPKRASVTSGGSKTIGVVALQTPRHWAHRSRLKDLPGARSSWLTSRCPACCNPGSAGTLPAGG
jgi:hypothetical protein